MNDLLTIKGTVFWAFLDTRNQMSGDYQVDIGQLSDAAVKALEGMGIEVKHKDQMGYFITCKSKNFPIVPIDSDGDTIEGIKVGNGSKCVAVLDTYEWEFKKKKGVSPSLKKLKITELIKYEAEDAIDVDEDEAM